MSTPLPHFKNFLAGRWVDAEQALNVIDPSTGAAFATMACADKAQLDQALAAARACVNRGDLTRTRPAERSQWMHRVAQEIRQLADEGAWLLAEENGKNVADARTEFELAARYFEYYGGMADKIEGASIPLGDDYVDFTLYEPLGVSAQIVPWNFPVDICARSLAPALAAGNAVVVKTPELTPLAVSLLGRACERAGLPDGALSLLCGLGPDLGAALVGHPEVDQIVFTGSVATGQSILRTAAERAVPCVMEMGGKSAAVVFDDYDSEHLLASVKSGIFFNAGQVCSALSRLLVHRSVYPQVLEAVTELAQSLTPGSFRDTSADLTPVISEDQQKKILGMCRQAEDQGARLMTGGYIPQAPEQGYYISPTVFADVSTEMTLFQKEVFGPVLALTPFDTEEDAWALANATEYGLVAGVFTRDLARSLRAARALQSGQVFVNEWFAGGIETPFGGVKRSGYGREKGQEALYNYVATKNVAIRVS